jgi:RNA polymerase sigma factor for flagellar operon FliA
MEYKPEYGELVRAAIFKSFGYRGQGMDDLLAAGFEGLVKAMNNCNTDGDKSFRAYAYTKIVGAARDYLRSIDGMGRLPRSKFIKIENQRAALEGEFCRHIQRSELSQLIDEPLSKIDNLYSSARQSNVTLQNGVDDGFAEFDNGLHDDIEFAVSTLNDRDRRIIIGVYIEGLTYNDLAAEMNLTESRICQLIKAALKKLRKPMQPWSLRSC